jgi:hypothetical protein
LLMVGMMEVAPPLVVAGALKTIQEIEIEEG